GEPLVDVGAGDRDGIVAHDVTFGAPPAHQRVEALGLWAGRRGAVPVAGVARFGHRSSCRSGGNRLDAGLSAAGSVRWGEVPGSVGQPAAAFLTSSPNRTRGRRVEAPRRPGPPPGAPPRRCRGSAAPPGGAAAATPCRPRPAWRGGAARPPPAASPRLGKPGRRPGGDPPE